MSTDKIQLVKLNDGNSLPIVSFGEYHCAVMWRVTFVASQ